MTRSAIRVQVRSAVAADAERIAILAGQLGYPSTVETVLRQLPRIQSSPEHAVFVAEAPDGLVIGWLHVHAHHFVANDPRAEIGGLVVDENSRNAGVGRLLMEQAEQWARDKGYREVVLRSNVIRERAHKFYESLGYSVTKTQKHFRKAL